ncbi:hypothetical protein [Brevundimonas sp.]|uniref:hypothetical protein n=1 Tax=Brevundimonas sp. TaxID=1871086 RepID=UPI002ED969AB
MLTAAVLSTLILQQAAGGQVVWSTPAEPVAVVAPAAAPPIPDWARTDPFGYERSECSPLIRAASESMESCQNRVRFALSANLGDALPAALRPAGAADNCRQEAAGDRYALQCGAPSRPDRPATAMQEQVCETRPQARQQGGVAWTEQCRPASGGRDNDDGLKFRLGGRD